MVLIKRPWVTSENILGGTLSFQTMVTLLRFFLCGSARLCCTLTELPVFLLYSFLGTQKCSNCLYLSTLIWLILSTGLWMGNWPVGMCLDEPSKSFGRNAMVSRIDRLLQRRPLLTRQGLPLPIELHMNSH